MPYRHRLAPLRAAVALAYALAMALAGLAHGPAAVRSGTTAVDVAVLALPDGSLPQLCLGDGEAGDRQAVPAAGLCDACRLTAAPGLGPQPDPLPAPPDRRAMRFAVAVAVAAPLAAVHGPVPLARGPPPVPAVL